MKEFPQLWDSTCGSYEKWNRPKRLITLANSVYAIAKYLFYVLTSQTVLVTRWLGKENKPPNCNTNIIIPNIHILYVQ